MADLGSQGVVHLIVRSATAAENGESFSAEQLQRAPKRHMRFADKLLSCLPVAAIKLRMPIWIFRVPRTASLDCIERLLTEKRNQDDWGRRCIPSNIDCASLQHIRHLFCKLKVTNSGIIEFVKGPDWMVVKSLFNKTRTPLVSRVAAVSYPK